jgi:hypothetical protein
MSMKSRVRVSVEEAAGSYSDRAYMRTARSTIETAKKILGSFEYLSSVNPTLITRFAEAYSHRSKCRELAESEPDGMLRALSSMLWTPAPAEYANGMAFQEQMQRRIFLASNLEQSFSQEVREAINRLPRENPALLEDISDFQKQSQRSFHQILAIQIAFYIDNKEVLPF